MITVLIIDDNDMDRRLAVQVLQDAARNNHSRIEIIQARDGEAGLWALENREPDLVVCDIDLKRKVNAVGDRIPEGLDLIRLACAKELDVIAYYGQAIEGTWAMIPAAARKANKSLGQAGLRAQLIGILGHAERHHGLAHAG